LEEAREGRIEKDKVIGLLINYDYGVGLLRRGTLDRTKRQKMIREKE